MLSLQGPGNEGVGTSTLLCWPCHRDPLLSPPFPTLGRNLSFPFFFSPRPFRRILASPRAHLHLCYTCGPCSTCRTPLRGDNPPDIREFHQIAHHPLPPPRAPGVLRSPWRTLLLPHAWHWGLAVSPYPLSRLCCSHVPSRLWSLSHAVALTLADFLESSDVLTCLLFWS